MIKRIIVSLVVLVLLGCDGKSNTDLQKIKGGMLKFNRTMTIGEAFDRYDICITRDWAEFENENKQNVVEFRCELPLDYLIWDKESDTAKSAVAAMQKQGCVMFLRYQFKVNANQTFDILHSEIVTTDKNGNISKYPIGAIDSINRIYENKDFIGRE